MEVIRWSFAFYRAVSLREISTRRQDWRCVFGHVSAYGYTADENWLFYDPMGQGTQIRVVHRHDEVLDQIAAIYAAAEEVLSIEPTGRKYRLPLHPPMTCVTQCAALVGLRAYTPWGFRKMLLREGAEVIFQNENAERGSEGQGSAAARAAHRGT